MLRALLGELADAEAEEEVLVLGIAAREVDGRAARVLGDPRVARTRATRRQIDDRLCPGNPFNCAST